MQELPTIAASQFMSNTLDMDKWQFADADVKMKAMMAIAQRQDPPRNQEPKTMPTRRLVQVFIADSNDNVPLEDSLLYRGEQKLTDATDQELFFEVDIRTLLEKHNAKRVKVVDKKVKERTEYLEPAKIRDLKMVVVTVAGF